VSSFHLSVIGDAIRRSSCSHVYDDDHVCERAITDVPRLDKFSFCDFQVQGCLADSVVSRLLKDDLTDLVWKRVYIFVCVCVCA